MTTKHTSMEATSMNLSKLKQAEQDFFSKHPMGFQSPELIELGKKHKMDKMINSAQAGFKKSYFSKTDDIIAHMVKLVGQSSMVSMFEKPKFRDAIATLEQKERKKLVGGLKQFLHGNQEKGFNDMLNVLLQIKLGKWSLLTILPNYFHPHDEVFVKPTTAKGVIQFFELDGLHYHPTPSWAFYENYKAEILKMKSLVGEELSPNNAAFCGFLMMTMNK